MNFRLWLEAEFHWNAARLPYLLRGLAAEARKAGSYENFRKDYLQEIKHGLYWHWTDDANFQIDSEKGPRDMSSMGNNSMTKGELMITSHLEYWSGYGPEGKGRAYAAIIDMSDVPRQAYRQVKRGFGNEFLVSDPSLAKVYKVLGRRQAQQFDRSQNKYRPQSNAELEAFYAFATGESLTGVNVATKPTE